MDVVDWACRMGLLQEGSLDIVAGGRRNKAVVIKWNA